jgi:ankyrin repeat protein
MMGETEVVKVLLDKGANIDAKDSNGETALNKAENGKKSGTVKLLRESGAH